MSRAYPEVALTDSLRDLQVCHYLVTFIADSQSPYDHESALRTDLYRMSEAGMACTRAIAAMLQGKRAEFEEHVGRCGVIPRFFVVAAERGCLQFIPLLARMGCLPADDALERARERGHEAAIPLLLEAGHRWRSGPADSRRRF